MRSPIPSTSLEVALGIVALFCLSVSLADAQDFARSPGATCTTAPGCVTSYHNDNTRDGVNGNETLLTPSIVSGSTFTLLKNFDNLDGLVYAQPLYLSGVTMASTTNCAGSNKNIAIVATENNTIYVYDVTPGYAIQECYHTNTNASGENAIPFTDLKGTSPECTNLVPQEGITGTPAIDTAVTPPALYFVSGVKTSTSWDFKLNVMRLDSGSPAHGTPFYLSNLIISQTGGVNSPFSAINENQRSGLALFHPPVLGAANLYVAFGSHCDSTPFQGYVAGFQFVYGTSTLNNLGVFQSENVTGGSAGGIWMSGAAPAVDSNGNVYVAVGNGLWNGQPNSPSVPTKLGQSVVQLVQSGSTLTAVDYYTPNDYAYLNSGSGSHSVCVTHNTTLCPSQFSFKLTSTDYDLGSAGVTLIKPVGRYTSRCGTSNGELLAGGKEGVLYGICYNPSPDSLGTMGGLDSCGYNFRSACTLNLNSVAAVTACTQASAPTPGKIAQCFYGTPTLGNQNSDLTGTRSTPAFWGGSSSSPQNYLYLAGDVNLLRGYQYSPGGTFGTPGAQATVPSTYGYPGATPSVSWNGVSGNTTTGLVWAIYSRAHGKYNLSTDKTTPAGAATLFGYKAIPDSLGKRLTNKFRSDAITLPPGTNHGPGAVKFTVPTIAAGLVFVGGGEANPVYYAPGQTTTPNANCTPSASGGSCLGGFYIYGTTHVEFGRSNNGMRDSTLRR
jgi:hypothetical protein